MTIKFLDLQAVYRQDQAAYDAAYQRVMASGRWILGPELEAFEADVRSRMYFKVSGFHGEMVTGFEDLPP